MFAVTQQTHYLHSITEPRWDLRQIVKNTYQFFTEADPFVVRYFSVKDMQQVIEKHRRDEMHALRHKSFIPWPISAPCRILTFSKTHNESIDE